MAKVLYGSLIDDRTTVGTGGSAYDISRGYQSPGYSTSAGSTTQSTATKERSSSARSNNALSAPAPAAKPAAVGSVTEVRPYDYAVPVDAALIRLAQGLDAPSDTRSAGSNPPASNQQNKPASSTPTALNEWGSVEGYNPYANPPVGTVGSGTPVSYASTTATSTPVKRTGGTDYLEQWYNQYPSYNDQIVQGIKTGYSDMEENLRRANAAAVEKGILEQQAALQNALPYYNQMIAQNARDKLIAGDNLALRNASAGDLGGIGQKMYSDQQNAYDSRLYAIELEQINLQNTINQQIANLRAQGEFELADALLELGQNRMAALTNQYNTYASNRASWGGAVDNYNLSRDNLAYEQAMQRLQLGLFNAEDAAALGVDAAQAKAFSDRINLLAQLNVQQAQAELENTYSAIRAREAAAAAATTPVVPTSGNGNVPLVDWEPVMKDGTILPQNTESKVGALYEDTVPASPGVTVPAAQGRMNREFKQAMGEGNLDSANAMLAMAEAEYNRSLVNPLNGAAFSKTSIPGLSQVYGKFRSTSPSQRDGVLSTDGQHRFYELIANGYAANPQALLAQLYNDTINGVIDEDDYAGLMHVITTYAR